MRPLNGSLHRDAEETAATTACATVKDRHALHQNCDCVCEWQDYEIENDNGVVVLQMCSCPFVICDPCPTNEQANLRKSLAGSKRHNIQAYVERHTLLRQSILTKPACKVLIVPVSSSNRYHKQLHVCLEGLPNDIERCTKGH